MDKNASKSFVLKYSQFILTKYHKLNILNILNIYNIISFSQISNLSLFIAGIKTGNIIFV